MVDSVSLFIGIIERGPACVVQLLPKRTSDFSNLLQRNSNGITNTKHLLGNGRAKVSVLFYELLISHITGYKQHLFKYN